MDVEDFVSQLEAIEKASHVTVDDENEEIVTDDVWKETTFMGELIISFYGCYCCFVV